MTQDEQIKKAQKKQAIKDKKTLEEKGKVYEFVLSDGWKIIRNKLIDRIIDLDSIRQTPDEKVDRQHLLARQYAIDILYAWLSDVIGDAMDYTQIVAELATRKKEGMIIDLDDEKE